MPDGLKFRSREAKRLLVALNPASCAARAARTAAMGPCVLRSPKSTSGVPWAAIVTLVAKVASMIEKPRMFRKYDSRIWASMIEPWTSSSGSFGKNIVPSGMARIFTRGLKFVRCLRKSFEKMLIVFRYLMSLFVNWKFSR